jgi:acetyltransferase
MKIMLLDGAACACAREALADLLLDALDAGPALGFLPGLSVEAARRYWRDVEGAVRTGRRVLVAALHDGALVGVAQLVLAGGPDEDGAEVRAMIVARRARRLGIGSVLVRALEAEARVLGRDRLVADTDPGSGAEELVRDLGYARDGADGRYAKTLRMPEAA